MPHFLTGLNLVCVSAMLQVALLLASAPVQRRRQSLSPPLVERRAAADSNDILRGDVGDLQCAKLIADVKWAEASVSARLPADPTGTWVSQRCETRTGPEFLLRKYTFYRNATFRLVQHFYADHACSTPVFSVVAQGELQAAGPSWTVPGATEADYVLRSVRLAAHSRDMAEALSARANRTCHSMAAIGWRHDRWYDVYSYAETSERAATSYPPIPQDGVSVNSTFNATIHGLTNGSTWDLSEGLAALAPPSKVQAAAVEGVIDEAEDVDCLQALDLSFDELQLLRVEVRKSGRQLSRQQRHWKRRKTELLMGEVLTDVDSGRPFRPTSYQQPLLRIDQLDSCALCRAVNKAPDIAPPFHHSPELDSGAARRPHVRGEWLSTRCETRPNSLFLTRRLLFSSSNRGSDDSATWRGFYHFYGDPRCSRQPLFSLRLRGRYSLDTNATSWSSSASLSGATVAEFRLDRIGLTPHTAAMAANLNGHVGDTCGRRGTWRQSVPQDLGSTRGCSGLGLRVPSRQREILRVENDEYGGTWLYLGQTHHLQDDDQMEQSNGPLATSYQWPLLRCRTTVGQDDVIWGGDDDDEEEEDDVASAEDQGQLDNNLNAIPLGGAVYSSRLDAEAPPHGYNAAAGDLQARSIALVMAGAIWWRWSQLMLAM